MEARLGFPQRSRPLDEIGCALKLFRQHPFNPRHIVVTNRIRLPVIPSDGDFTPRRSDNRALIGGRRAPANALAYFEESGLGTGHLRFTYKFNSVHRVVACKALMTVVPFYSDVSQLSRGYLAAICRVTVEENASADL
jgi:hypothetical protein